jgi:hypothetical protein
MSGFSLRSELDFRLGELPLPPANRRGGVFAARFARRLASGTLALLPPNAAAQHQLCIDVTRLRRTADFQVCFEAHA